MRHLVRIGHRIYMEKNSQEARLKISPDILDPTHHAASVTEEQLSKAICPAALRHR